MLEQIKTDLIKIIDFIKKTGYTFYLDELNDFNSFEKLNFNNKLSLLNLFWSIYHVMNIDRSELNDNYEINILKHLLNCINITQKEDKFLNNYNKNEYCKNIIFEIIKTRYIKNNDIVLEYDQETNDLLKIQHISMESQIIPFQYSHLNSNILKELKIENLDLKNIKLGYSIVYGIYQDIIGFIFLKDKQILGPFIKETYYDILYSYLLTKMLLNIKEDIVYSFYGLNIENDIEKYKNIIQILNYDFNIQTKNINGYSTTFSNIYYNYDHHENNILIKNNIPILKSLFNKLKYSEIEYKLLFNVLNVQPVQNLDKLTLSFNNSFQIILFNEYNKSNIEAKTKSLSFYQKFYDICKKLIEQSFINVLVSDIFGQNIAYLWLFIMDETNTMEINGVIYNQISDFKLLLNSKYTNENFDEYFNILKEYFNVISDLIKYDNIFMGFDKVTDKYRKKIEQILKFCSYTNSDLYITDKNNTRYIENIFFYLVATILNKFFTFLGNEIIGNEYYKNYDFYKVEIKNITDYSKKTLLNDNNINYDVLNNRYQTLNQSMEKIENRSFKIDNNSNYTKYIKELKVIFSYIFGKTEEKKEKKKEEKKKEENDDIEEKYMEIPDSDEPEDENDIYDRNYKKKEKDIKNPQKIFYKGLGILTYNYKTHNGEKLLYDLEYWKNNDDMNEKIDKLLLLFNCSIFELKEKTEIAFGNIQNRNEFFMNFPNEIIKLNIPEIVTLKKIEIKKEKYFTVVDSLLLKSIDNLYLLPKQVGLIFINQIIQTFTNENYSYNNSDDIFLKESNFNNFLLLLTDTPLDIFKNIIKEENGANCLKTFFTYFMQKYTIKDYSKKEDKMETIDTSMNHLFHLQSKIESFISTNIKYNEILLETFQDFLKQYGLDNLQNTNLLLKLLIISLFKCKAFKVIKNLNQKTINTEKLKDIILEFQIKYLTNTDTIFNDYNNWSIIIKKYKNEFLNILGSSYLLKILYLLDSNNIKIKLEAKEKLIKSNMSIELIINDFH